MFNLHVEERIRDAINERTGLSLTNEDIHKMKVVPDVNRNPEMTILCLQEGRKTILTSIKISDNGQELLIGEIEVVIW